MSTPAARSSLLMVAGVFVLALIGIGFLVLSIFLLTRPKAPKNTLVAPTLAFTSVVVIPTTTPAPPTNTPEPTATATTPPTETPPAEPSATEFVAQARIVQPANVRGGPGLTYPVLGGLNSGDTAALLGRDASAQWFAIQYALGPNGVGWVSALVATVDGSVNDLPVVAADAPPPAATSAPPTATNPPAATNPPPPSATPQLGARGIVANSFSVENASAAVGQDVWFNFEVKNTSSAAVAYGVLAAHTDAGVTAQSWTNESLDPGETLTWRDHINFPAAGTYQLYLGICFGDKNACLSGGAGWDRLSNNITITIIN
ncbi:MAG: SH3 domain-containing protein [Anaerolineales bacterium]|nr:SH3 domain-containing protein [Anaerolineales bacterium]